MNRSRSINQVAAVTIPASLPYCITATVRQGVQGGEPSPAPLLEGEGSERESVAFPGFSDGLFVSPRRQGSERSEMFLSKALVGGARSAIGEKGQRRRLALVSLKLAVRFSSRYQGREGGGAQKQPVGIAWKLGEVPALIKRLGSIVDAIENHRHEGECLAGVEAVSQRLGQQQLAQFGQEKRKGVGMGNSDALVGRLVRPPSQIC